MSERSELECSSSKSIRSSPGGVGLDFLLLLGQAKSKINLDFLLLWDQAKSKNKNCFLTFS